MALLRWQQVGPLGVVGFGEIKHLPDRFLPFINPQKTESESTNDHSGQKEVTNFVSDLGPLEGPQKPDFAESPQKPDFAARRSPEPGAES